MKHAFTNKALHLSVLALFVGSLVGCQVSDTVFIKAGGGGSALDDELEAALVSASGGQGLDYFKLPSSNDYASIPQDPNNPITKAKVDLGRLLFHETGLLVSPMRPEGVQTASCASCHHAAAGFQAGRIQGVGEGGSGFGVHGEARFNDPNYQIAQLDVQPIRSPTAMNAAYQEVMLWNGQFGGAGINLGTEASWTPGTPKETNLLGYTGVETQAIAGLKVHRLAPIENSLVATNATYQAMFAAAFPTGQPNGSVLPVGGAVGLREQTGLAIAAFERTMMANAAPFQRWLRGSKNAMTDQEKRGAVLFFGKANCSSCHTGPALNSMTFYAIGAPDLDGPGVYGDVVGKAENKGRGGFTGRAEDMFKFKTPQLYNLKDSPFYGHGGTFNTVREVVEYKNSGIPSNPDVPASQLAPQFQPLNLTAAEVDDLVAFVENGLYDPQLSRYLPTSLPSGNCFPNNDPGTRADLGCN
jgi:cytochrome c peroxidase